MAERGDVTINPVQRLVTVAAPSTEIEIQDLVDTIRAWEEEIDSLQWPKFIDATGKEVLDANTNVGITTSILNARLAFEARNLPAETGTVTTADSGGIVLKDSAGQFETNEIAEGAAVINFTDFSVGTVFRVLGEDELELVQALAGGTDNEFELGDDYRIYNIEVCRVSGGNLVGLDALGDPATPFQPTFGVAFDRTSSASATLQELLAIQFAAYNGGVTIDPLNISGVAGYGTTYFTGTLRQPCLDTADALVIMAFYGFQKMFVMGSANFTSAHNINGKIIIGTSHVQNVINLADGCGCVNSVFRELEILGKLDGGNEVSNCIVSDLTYFDGHIHDSGLKGEIVLAGGRSSVLADCITIDPFSPPSIDMGDSGQDLSMPGYAGLLKVRNMSGPTNFIGIGLASGQVILEDTITAGLVHVSGVGQLIDELGERIPSGIWNGGVTVVNDTINESSVAKSNWTEIAFDSVNGVDETEYPAGFPERPVNNPTALKNILEENNRHIVRGHGTLTLSGDWSGYTIKSDGYDRLTVVLDDTIAAGLVLDNLTFGGTIQSGEIEATKCKCTGIIGGSMDFDDVQMANTYKPESGGYIRMDRCSSSDVGGCFLNANGDAVINMANGQGIFTVLNATDPTAQHGFTGDMVLTLYGGSSPGMSVTAGTFFVAILGIFQDHLENPLVTGAWNGATLISRAMPGSAWDEILSVANHPIANSAAEKIRVMEVVQAGGLVLSADDGGTMYIYDDDNTTLIASFALWADEAKTIRTNVPADIIARTRL